MINKIFKTLLILGFLVSNIVNVSAGSITQQFIGKTIRSDYYTDENDKIIRFDTILVSSKRIKIVDESGNAIAQVDFDSDISVKPRIENVQTSEFVNQLYTTSYVSTYDLWGAQYSFPGGQSHFKVTFYGTYTIPMISTVLVTSFGILFQPSNPAQFVVAIVSTLASITYPLYQNKIFNYYWKRYYRLNVFCPILGQAQFKVYKDATYATNKYIVGGDVTAVGIGDWYGGTPYDFTQPAQCRDLVLQYPY
jgi:hypothetical protein